MEYTYILRIHAAEKWQDKLTSILGVQPNDDYGWAYKLVEGEDDAAIPFIDEFLKLLEGNEKELEKCGVLPEHIEIWMIYEYEGQCNLEFAPSDLKRLGEKGIKLCLSCYEA